MKAKITFNIKCTRNLCKLLPLPLYQIPNTNCKVKPVLNVVTYYNLSVYGLSLDILRHIWGVGILTEK